MTSVRISPKYDPNKTYPVFVGHRCVEVSGDCIPKYVEREMTFEQRLHRVEHSLARAGLLIDIMDF
jgi:hypothetical protein